MTGPGKGFTFLKETRGRNCSGPSDEPELKRGQTGAKWTRQEMSEKKTPPLSNRMIPDGPNDPSLKRQRKQEEGKKSRTICGGAKSKGNSLKQPAPRFTDSFDWAIQTVKKGVGVLKQKKIRPIKRERFGGSGGG